MSESISNEFIKPGNSNVDIISVHVPKTGGTTFKRVLKQVYGDEEIFFDYPHKGPIRNKLLTSDRSEIRIIHGHFPGDKYDDKYPDARKVIWLRNPINRLISHYFFWKSWQVLTVPRQRIEADDLRSVVEFAERPEVQNILAANFLKNQSLKDFYFVGIQEFFREDLIQLERVLKWQTYELEDKNKNPYPEYELLLEKLLASPEVIRKIRNLNREDIEIYTEGLNRREERINKWKAGKNIWINSQRSPLAQKNNRKTIEPLISWGSVDRIVLQNQVLGLSGWVASWKSGPVEGFKVVIGDREYTFFEQLLGIPSPDVQDIHPSLDNAQEARFRLRILLDRQQIEELNRWAIALTPIFSGSEGIILLKVFSPTLPTPRYRDIKIVRDAGPEEFTRNSFKFMGLLLQRVGLQGTDRILELGCNVGQTAYSLVYYLKPSGSYEGLDFAREPISWAKQEITPRKPNFCFRWGNVSHPIYNPNGIMQGIDFSFPYPPESFDYVCIPHIFMHLRSAEVRHYLNQIAKLLKPGGLCLLAGFIMNSESEEFITGGGSSQNLIYELEEGFTSDRSLPERAIGFRESLLLKWIDDAGLILRQKSYGSWCGRVSFGGPDLLVLEKAL